MPSLSPPQQTLDAQLFKAVQRNDLVAINTAIEHGANVNASKDQAHRYQTVLSAAVLCATEPLVKRLLTLGAHPNANTDEGETATYVAWSQKRKFFPLLQRYGGDLEQAFRQGGENRSVLHRTLEDLDQGFRNDPDEMQEPDSWFYTGGDLPALIALNARWDRAVESKVDGRPFTADDALHSWFPGEFVQRVMGWRSSHEQTVLRTFLDQQSDTMPSTARERARL